MVRCSVKNCSNRSARSDGGMPFHSFPDDPKLRESWIAATGREDWVPTQFSKICNEHFISDTFSSHTAKYAEEPSAVSNEYPLKSDTGGDESMSSDVPNNKYLIEIKVEDASGYDDIAYSSPKEEIDIQENDVQRPVPNDEDPIYLQTTRKKLQQYQKQSNDRLYKLKQTQKIANERLRKLRVSREKCNRLKKKVTVLHNIIDKLKMEICDIEDDFKINSYLGLF